MNDRFQFLKTYADSLIELEKADKNLARELAWKIINYGIYNNDEDSGNPIIEAMFVQIKLMIDKGQAISKANSINGKKGGRPEKNWENSQKANGKRNESEQKANGKQDESESETKKSKIENRKEKKENIKEENNNKLTLIGEDKSSQENYGNKEVNECLALIKHYNNGIINGSDSTNRRYAWNLIRKLNQLESIQNGAYKWNEVLDSILMIISKDEYHRTKIGSPKLIYDNLASLIQRMLALGEKQNPQGESLELI